MVIRLTKNKTARLSPPPGPPAPLPTHADRELCHYYSTNSSCVASILTKLDKIKQTGPGRWVARCPAHNDRMPSLSVREAGDGKILLKCFAGCPAERVLAALGLGWRDLFPSRPNALRGDVCSKETLNNRAARVLQKAYEQALQETLAELADLLREIEAVLALPEAWGVVFSDHPLAVQIAKLVHLHRVVDFLFEELYTNPSLEILTEIWKKVEKWTSGLNC